MVRSYRAGETEERHVHKIAREVTVIVSGRFLMNGREVATGDIVDLSPGEDTDFVCLEDGTTAVIKTPSVIGDKYLM